MKSFVRQLKGFVVALSKVAKIVRLTRFDLMDRILVSLHAVSCVCKLNLAIVHHRCIAEKCIELWKDEKRKKTGNNEEDGMAERFFMAQNSGV